MLNGIYQHVWEVCGVPAPFRGFVDGVTVNILMETCHEGAAVCAQVGSSKGRPRDFSSMPLAHKLDWVSTRLGLLMCGTVEKWDYLWATGFTGLHCVIPKTAQERQGEWVQGLKWHIWNHFIPLGVSACVSTCLLLEWESEDRWILALTFYLIWGTPCFPTGQARLADTRASADWFS